MSSIDRIITSHYRIRGRCWTDVCAHYSGEHSFYKIGQYQYEDGGYEAVSSPRFGPIKLRRFADWQKARAWIEAMA